MVLFMFNTVIYVFLLLGLCILIVWLCIIIVPAGNLRLSWRRFFRVFSSVVRLMPGYNSQRRGTARTLPKIFVLFCVLFLCKCVLYYWHRVTTQLQLTNISYNVMWHSKHNQGLILHNVLIKSPPPHFFSGVNVDRTVIKHDRTLSSHQNWCWRWKMMFNEAKTVFESDENRQNLV